MGVAMRAIKLDPARLLGFKIVSSEDQDVLLTSGVLNSAKIGDKGWPSIQNDMADVSTTADEAARR